jgi:mono/diheme cytochrome c family protein
MRIGTRRLGWPMWIALIAMGASAVCRADEAADSSGPALFREFCATCHGVDGRGGGPAALDLSQQPPDLRLIAARHGGVFPDTTVRRLIDGRTVTQGHGTREMPVWGWEFYGYEGEDATRRRAVAELIDRLVDYLRSIQISCPDSGSKRDSTCVDAPFRIH